MNKAGNTRRYESVFGAPLLPGGRQDQASDAGELNRFPGTDTSITVIAEPTPDQRDAFDLIGTLVPLTCT